MAFSHVASFGRKIPQAQLPKAAFGNNPLADRKEVVVMVRAEPMDLHELKTGPQSTRIDAHGVRNRKIEDWIVSTLGGDRDTAPSDDWRDLFARIAPIARRPNTSKGRNVGGWERFRLVARKGITVVSLTDRALIREHELSEFAGDLTALIESGHHRMILNFSAVERLSSWAVAAIAEASRKCEAVQGGMLKICGLRSQLVSVFAITALDKKIKIYSDENSALDSLWPDTPDVLPLPIEILTCLNKATRQVSWSFDRSDRQRDDIDSTEDFPIMSGAWLVSDKGSSQGRMIIISHQEFIIGRDASCHLRIDDPVVSRQHACLQQQADRFLLRDLGSTNGTFLNGRPVRDECPEIYDGDRILIGGIGFAFTTGVEVEAPSADRFEEIVASWLKDDTSRDLPERDAPPTEEIAIPEGLDGKTRLKSEIIEGIVVVTPLGSDLDDEQSIGPLREELLSIFEGPYPRQVVINLSHVGHLSGRAIGLLIAHQLKLEREGGSLRVCVANPRVSAVLEQAKFNMLVECHDSLDDAVLTYWSGTVDDMKRNAI